MKNTYSNQDNLDSRSEETEHQRQRSHDAHAWYCRMDYHELIIIPDEFKFIPKHLRSLDVYQWDYSIQGYSNYIIDSDVPTTTVSSLHWIKFVPRVSSHRSTMPTNGSYATPLRPMWVCGVVVDNNCETSSTVSLAEVCNAQAAAASGLHARRRILQVR